MPLSAAGATRTRDALTKLSKPGGPVFVTLAGSDVASYVFLQVAKQLPASTDSFAARVVDDRVELRAEMQFKDLGAAVLGPAAALLNDREQVQLSGTLSVIGKGLAEFRVREVRVRDLSLPSSVIPRLIKSLVRGQRPTGLDDDALPLTIPTYIGDVRVAKGKITLYKNIQ
jgi:hypothetical protein